MLEKNKWAVNILLYKVTSAYNLMNKKGESVVVPEAFQGRTILNIWSESPVPQQQVQQHGYTNKNDWMIWVITDK